MNNKIFCLALGALLLALSFPAEAQQQIGYLSAQSEGRGSRGGANEVVRRELHALGYVGKNIVFEYRYSDNKLDRLPSLADELVRLKVDLLLTTSTPSALAAKNATRTIPIVFLGSGDHHAGGESDQMNFRFSIADPSASLRTGFGF